MRLREGAQKIRLRESLILVGVFKKLPANLSNTGFIKRLWQRLQYKQEWSLRWRAIALGEGFHSKLVIAKDDKQRVLAWIVSKIRA